MNAFVQFIGYQLAKALADKLWQAIISLYADNVIRDAKENASKTSEERHAILIAIKATNNKTQRRNLMSALNKLG